MGLFDYQFLEVRGASGGCEADVVEACGGECGERDWVGGRGEGVEELSEGVEDLDIQNLAIVAINKRSGTRGERVRDNGQGDCADIVDAKSKMENNDRVATISVRERVTIIARGGVGLVVPCEVIARIHDGVGVRIVRRAESEVDKGNGIAAVVERAGVDGHDSVRGDGQARDTISEIESALAGIVVDMLRGGRNLGDKDMIVHIAAEVVDTADGVRARGRDDSIDDKEGATLTERAIDGGVGSKDGKVENGSLRAEVRAEDCRSVASCGIVILPIPAVREVGIADRSRGKQRVRDHSQIERIGARAAESGQIGVGVEARGGQSLRAERVRIAMTDSVAEDSEGRNDGEEEFDSGVTAESGGSGKDLMIATSHGRRDVPYTRNVWLTATDSVAESAESLSTLEEGQVENGVRVRRDKRMSSARIGANANRDGISSEEEAMTRIVIREADSIRERVTVNDMEEIDIVEISGLAIGVAADKTESDA